ncbi:MAG: FG-GAP-like repeat-containing protein [Terracidiphilus sp.]|nr:FG-GAP-like repeat-containing protein [Terracidiphilus sp.]
MLGAATRGVAWSTVNTSAPSVAGVSYAVADLNGDGIPDLFVKDYFGTYDVLLGNGDGTFTVEGSPFGPSSETGSFIVGDFNNDGIPDVAAINAAVYAPTGDITIFLGNGDGTFTVAGSSPALGYNPTTIATADINGDGNADLIVVQQGSSTSSGGEVVIFFGNGDGTFTQASSTTSVPSVPGSIIPAGLNGDGQVDLVLSGLGASGVTILLGKGDGTFTSLAGPSQAGEANVAVADVNNDGFPDLVFGAAGTSYLTVFLGNGDGTFTEAPSSPNANIKVGGLAIADFNQDGIPDIAYTYGQAGILFGNGDGTFVQSPATLTYSYDFSGTIVVADFNGDGWPDVLTEDGNSRTVIDSLTQPTETATATAAASIAVAGAHLADASYPGDSNYNPSASGTIALWGAPPTTTAALAITSGGTTVSSVTPGTVVALTAAVKAGANPVTHGQVNFCDASASQCTDIHLLATVALASSGTAAFKFVPGTGVHSYKAEFVQDGYGLRSSSSAATLTVGPAPSPVYSDTTTITASGFPGDYSLTATVVGFGGSAAPTGSVSFLDTSFANASLGTANLGLSTAGIGWLISQTPAVGSNPISEIPADFNGDGIPDLAILWDSTIYSGPPSVTILFGKGDGTFTTGPTVQVTGAQGYPTMIGGDFNGDGKTDLAVLSGNGYSTSYVTTLLSNGDGTFGAPQTGTVCDQGAGGGNAVPESMVAADFNGDGKLDLAVVGQYVSPGGVAILFGNGDGTFTPAGPDADPSGDFGLIATGDFNGDGIPDLVATNYAEFGFAPTIFLGKGDGTFTAATASFPLDYFPTSIVVGDFNSDGVLDLAFSDLNGVEIALGNGDGTFKETSASPIAVPSELYSLTAGDFNHDGKLDIAGVDSYNDRIVLLTGAGDGAFTVTATTPVVSLDWLGPFAIVAADFNGDGVPDLAMLTKNVDTASILLTEPTQTATATINGLAPLGAGTHNVEASYKGGGNYPSSVSGTVALTAGLAPLVISPAAGTYSTAQTITIGESVPGAAIFYEGFGILNTNGFVPYTAPIKLTEGGVETIQAYATEAGYQSANTEIVTYTINLPAAPAPVFSPVSGSYPGAQTVAISDSAAGATIYYTTNGTQPTSASAVYSGSITVSTSETLVAYAIAPGYSASVAASAQYIVDSSPSSFIYTVAGNGNFGYTGDGGTATLADLNYPAGTALDSAGNLYIADSGNNVVRKVAAGTGVITTVAGTGLAGYSGDNGPATKAQLFGPRSLAFDSAGNLFISDAWNYVVRKVTATTGVITTYAGNGQGSYSGDNGAATAAGLGYPYGLALDSSGNLYIACPDSDRIRKIAAGTETITTVAGTGAYAYPYTGDNGPATSATLVSPEGVALDSAGNLYIADTEDNVVRVVNGSTQVITTYAGGDGQGRPYSGYTGDGGPAASAELNYPSSVTVDSAGNLYIADSNNGVIRKVTVGAAIIDTVVGNGTVCALYSGDGGPAASTSLCMPQSIFADSTGNLFVADTYTNRIRKVTASAPPPKTAAAAPILSVAAGAYPSPQSVTITDATPGAAIYVTLIGSAPATSATQLLAGPGYYNGPIDVTGSITVQAIAAAPGYLPSAMVKAAYTITTPPVAVISTVAGNGVFGFTGSGGPATSAEFEFPKGIALDGAGNLYFADQLNHVVWEVSAATKDIAIVAGNGTPGYKGDNGTATGAELYYPSAVALDSAGNLYIADSNNNVIRKVAAGTGAITTFAGNGHFGYPPNNGDGGPATSASLNYPAGLAFDSSGNLYIADTYADDVRMVAASSGIITTVAGGASGTETSSNNGDGGLATSALLNGPGALAFDAAGDLFIADSNAGRVRMVAAKTGIITTVAGDGDSGNSGDGGPATAAEVLPEGLAVDAAGNLYLSNSLNSVRKVAAATGVITTVAGNGFLAYSGDGESATVASIAGPWGIAFDAAGDLYIADAGHGRIRKVTFPGPAATPVIGLAAGAYTSIQSAAITDVTPGAVIYYTTDGTAPTTASNLYSAPITVSETEILQAIAVATGYTESAVATAAYTLNLPPGFDVSGKSVTVTPGATTANTSTITVTPAGGFTGSVALTAALTASPSGASDLPTFSFGVTAPVLITGASPGTATLTITTTAATSGALSYPMRPGLPWYAAGGSVLACLLLLGIPARRRGWRSMVVLLVLLVALAGGVLSCGGGGNGGGGGGGGGGGNPGTTAGIYTIKVTGTSGASTQTGTVTLTVQ